MTDTATFGFSGPTVCRLTGVTYRQLDYWARTGLVTPSITPATGSGSKRALLLRRRARSEGDQVAADLGRLPHARSPGRRVPAPITRRRSRRQQPRAL